jgi:hypothetical protein
MAGAEGARGLLRIELELEMDREPVRGVLHSGGRSEAFVGWLALADALGRLHDAQGPSQGAETRP